MNFKNGRAFAKLLRSCHSAWDVAYQSLHGLVPVPVPDMKHMLTLSPFCLKAFRKITKKWDKTMTDQSGIRYFRDRVNKAYFVTSNMLDVLVLSAEDYYARYFERGSQYAARSYFRQPGYKSLSYDGSVLRAVNPVPFEHLPLLGLMISCRASSPGSALLSVRTA